MRRGPRNGRRGAKGTGSSAGGNGDLERAWGKPGTGNCGANGSRAENRECESREAEPESGRGNREWGRRAERGAGEAAAERALPPRRHSGFPG